MTNEIKLLKERLEKALLQASDSLSK